MTTTAPYELLKQARFQRSFWLVLLINTLWINLSEVFRYFVLIMPMLRESFPQGLGVAPMNWRVFASWALWDTLLVLCSSGFFWLFLKQFGNDTRNAMLAATLFWLSVFVILWLGLYNMNLATARIVGAALPLAWLEMVVAALFTSAVLRKAG